MIVVGPTKKRRGPITTPQEGQSLCGTRIFLSTTHLNIATIWRWVAHLVRQTLVKLSEAQGTTQCIDHPCLLRLTLKLTWPPGVQRRRQQGRQAGQGEGEGEGGDGDGGCQGLHPLLFMWASCVRAWWRRRYKFLKLAQEPHSVRLSQPSSYHLQSYTSVL